MVGCTRVTQSRADWDASGCQLATSTHWTNTGLMVDWHPLSSLVISLPGIKVHWGDPIGPDWDASWLQLGRGCWSAAGSALARQVGPEQLVGLHTATLLLGGAVRLVMLVRPPRLNWVTPVHPDQTRLNL